MIIKIDISNAFKTTCRALTLDVLSERASRDYASGLKRGNAIPTCENVFNLFCSKPCAHATLSYDTLTGTDRLTYSEGQNRRTAGGGLRDAST